MNDQRMTTPRTAAGPREAIIGMFATNEGDIAMLNEAFDAIEAEARAAEREHAAEIDAQERETAYSHGYGDGRRDGKAEARAAALDEARAAVGKVPVHIWDNGDVLYLTEVEDAIDALREGSGE